MMTYYEVSKQNGLTESNREKGNWLVIEGTDEQELQTIIDRYQLPDDIFIGSDEAEEVSRIEHLRQTKLNNNLSLVFLNLTANTEKRIEQRIAPVSFIYSDTLLITYTSTKGFVTEHLLKKWQSQLTSFEYIIAYSILTIYTHYIKELKSIKDKINQLDQAARKTTENKELFRLADAERDIVYLDHTLKDQHDTLEVLWRNKTFLNKLEDDSLVYDIQLRQRHADKMIRIYRDLLETIGGLFSDMMDNNLNHLMKYLDSAALVISIPALISGIWGMNTGGLPGKDSALGFFIIIVLAMILATIVAIYLSKKDFSK